MLFPGSVRAALLCSAQGRAVLAVRPSKSLDTRNITKDTCAGMDVVKKDWGKS